MMRRIVSGARHSGQCESTGVEGDGAGAVSISIMDAPFANRVSEFSSEGETGSRQENASNQESRAPFRFNRNGKGSIFCLSMISAQTRSAFVARENRYPLFRIML